MKTRYTKNIPFISSEDQAKIKDTHILFGGVGLGSVIAEVALRLGFEKFTFIDMDRVEVSNLNRQNYDMGDLNLLKVESITRRLQAINPNVQISSHNLFLDENSIEAFFEDNKHVKYDIAINALDFDNAAPFVFDDACIERGIKSIHPGNYSWVATAFLVEEEKQKFNEIIKKENGEYPTFAECLEFARKQIEDNYTSIQWFWDITRKFEEEEEASLPQLSVGANLAASLTTRLMYKLATNQPVKPFPFIYLLDVKYDE
ncbi:MAG TPA: hypothetical protein DCS93_02470 [Microscillaceae bacterium]|nr:hypothetical protein [Microscillaceae bacterium]